jgi:uncharacterized membrane protein
MPFAESRMSSQPCLDVESKAKVLGHPVHQMLIVFPLGLLATAVIFDVTHLLGAGPTMVAVAYWTMAAGIVGALVAAPFGTIDWLAIPADTRAKRIGALHGIGNLVVSALFIASWLLRADDRTAPGALALALSFGGAALSLLTAWLGGELVSRLGIGVYDDAHVGAPSSLDARPNSGERAQSGAV